MATFFLAEVYNHYHLSHIGLYASLELAKQASEEWFRVKVTQAIEESPGTYWGENPPAVIEWADGVEYDGYGEQPFAVLSGGSNYLTIADAFIISCFEVF